MKATEVPRLNYISFGSTGDMFLSCNRHRELSLVRGRKLFEKFALFETLSPSSSALAPGAERVRIASYHTWSWLSCDGAASALYLTQESAIAPSWIIEGGHPTDPFLRSIRHESSRAVLAGEPGSRTLRLIPAPPPTTPPPETAWWRFEEAPPIVFVSSLAGDFRLSVSFSGKVVSKRNRLLLERWDLEESESGHYFLSSQELNVRLSVAKDGSLITIHGWDPTAEWRLEGQPKAAAEGNLDSPVVSLVHVASKRLVRCDETTGRVSAAKAAPGDAPRSDVFRLEPVPAIEETRRGGAAIGNVATKLWICPTKDQPAGVECNRERHPWIIDAGDIPFSVTMSSKEGLGKLICDDAGDLSVSVVVGRLKPSMNDCWIVEDNHDGNFFIRSAAFPAFILSCPPDGRLHTSKFRQHEERFVFDWFSGPVSHDVPVPAPAPAPPATPQQRQQAEENLCVVCLERPKCVTLVHQGTGHMCCCAECAEDLKKAGQPCPLCRQPFESVIKTFV